MADNLEFDREWLQATLHINSKCEKAIRGTALKLFKAVIMATPVGKTSIWKTQYPPKKYVGGRLRSNWQCSTESPLDGELDNAEDDGASAARAMEAVIAAYKIGPSIFLANNLPYAEVIENGHSTQAPHGMVAVNVAEFQRVLDLNAKEAEST